MDRPIESVTHDSTAASLAARSARSLPTILRWLGIQHRLTWQFLCLRLCRDCKAWNRIWSLFLPGFCRACSADLESLSITTLMSGEGHCSKNHKALCMAKSSAEKVDTQLFNRNLWVTCLDGITNAEPTWWLSSLDPSVKIFKWSWKSVQSFSLAILAKMNGCSAFV